MKRVLLAFSGNDFSEETFEFAGKLNELKPLKLNGFFLPQSLTPVYEGVNAEIEEDKSKAIIVENANRFSRLCEQHKISYSILYGDQSLPMPQLIKQTRYSDLFIASSESFYRSFKSEEPHYYLNKALHQSECPLLLIPGKFDFPERIVFAYNGTESSVYAIKQFAYLFPEMCNKDILLVYECNDADDEIPGKDLIKELLQCHFKNVHYLKFTADSKADFNKWLGDKERILLVTGAGDRNTFSELFKKSFAKEIIEEHKLPLFIAHR